MIKIFVMDTCPDCAYVEEQIIGNDKFELVDIGQHVKNLKAFLRLRDNNPAFDVMKRVGSIGIPCFVLEDGTVTFKPEAVGLRHRPAKKSTSCRIDGSGC